MIGNKTADAVTTSYDCKITKNSQENNSEKVTNEYDKDMQKERYISPEKRQKIINELRII